MKLKSYTIDKMAAVITVSLSYFIILMMLVAFKSGADLIAASSIIFAVMGFVIIFYDYFRKRKFYEELTVNLERLDKKYLVHETISKPEFYEGKIICDILYDINKAMADRLAGCESDIEDFKEYVEMWIHEVKAPVQSLTLMCHNRGDVLDKSFGKQVRRLEDCTERILYYVRSNYAEQDFIIKKTRLDAVINHVALKNREDLLENEMNLYADLGEISVYTDSKWLEFILNQIINNSIKYKRVGNDDVPYIKIYAETFADSIEMCITDNGAGIPSEDIPLVFNKSFTGENGRTGTKSTGMGLYIAYKLCKKLGHTIGIESVRGAETTVKITFGLNKFHDLQI